MKRQNLLKAAVALLCCIAPLLAQTTRSPEVSADRQVTFRLRAPAATAVAVSGEFAQGNTPLQKGSDGIWTVTVGPLDPEIYAYNFTIDGVRTIDPGNPGVKTGSTASTISSLLNVPADGPAFYDIQPVPHGEIGTHWYDSKSLHSPRRMTVYTPPGYDKSGATRYPVLYLFHGANADETAWTKLGHVNLILDNLLAAGKINPFVVVMPFGYPGPPETSRSDFSAITEAFGRDLMGDVIPFIDAHYRTLSDRDHRAIAGLSMGGMESLDIGLNHPELFSAVAGFSPAIRPASFDKEFAKLKSNPEQANKQLRALWIGCGTDDSLFSAAQSFSGFLDAAGIHHTFHKSAGAHTWMNWRHYLAEFAPLAFGVPAK